VWDNVVGYPHDDASVLHCLLKAGERLGRNVILSAQMQGMRADVAQKGEAGKTISKLPQAHTGPTIDLVVTVHPRLAKKGVGHWPEVAITGEKMSCTVVMAGVGDALETRE
jgi:hypothetical protein